MNDLGERVRQGRRAVALGKARGLDTSQWEQRLAELERQLLLGWASAIAERGTPLPQPAQFHETPSCPITLQDGGMLQRYVKEKLRFLALADNYRVTGGPDLRSYPPQWWQAREQDVLHALAALREAIESQQKEVV